MEAITHKLASELGLDKLPPDQQQQFLDRIGTIIYQAVLIRAFELLTEEQKSELDAQLAATASNAGDVDKSATDLFVFFAKNIPHFENIVEEEIARFKAESMDLFQSLAK
jgi:hypothetical protein